LVHAVFVDRLCAPADWFVEVAVVYMLPFGSCSVFVDHLRAPAGWFVVVKTPPQTSPV
jgi:hypothetical protein